MRACVICNFDHHPHDFRVSNLYGAPVPMTFSSFFSTGLANIEVNDLNFLISLGFVPLNRSRKPETRRLRL